MLRQVLVLMRDPQQRAIVVLALSSATVSLALLLRGRRGAGGEHFNRHLVRVGAVDLLPAPAMIDQEQGQEEEDQVADRAHGRETRAGHQELWHDPAAASLLECPICFLVLRDPMACKCGSRFCGPCISQWQGDCPTCRTSPESLVPDHAARREVRNLMIMCGEEDQPSDARDCAGDSSAESVAVKCSQIVRLGDKALHATKQHGKKVELGSSGDWQRHQRGHFPDLSEVNFAAAVSREGFGPLLLGYRRPLQRLPSRPGPEEARHCLLRLLPYRAATRSSYVLSYKPPFVEVQYRARAPRSLAKRLVFASFYLAAFFVVSLLLDKAEQLVAALLDQRGDLSLRVPAKTLVPPAGEAVLSYPFSVAWTEKRGSTIFKYLLRVSKSHDLIR